MEDAKLADAHRALARSYPVPSWPRLVQACQLIERSRFTGKQLHPVYGGETMHEYCDVAPISWGQKFHRCVFVSEPAMKLVAERGGRP